MSSDIWRRWSRVAVINLAVAAGLLLALEGLVRATRPEIGPAVSDAALFADSAYADATGASPGLAPGASGLANGARVSITPGGAIRYRGNAAAADSAWLLLGDSVTFGVGVAPDSTFAGRLATRTDLRVVNPSVLGYDTDDYLRAGRHWLRAAPVARVTLVWCLNDAYPAGDGADATAEIRPRSSALLGWLNAHSRLYRWTKAAALDRPMTYLRHDRQFYAGPSLKAALDRVATLASEAAQRGVPVEVVVLPYEPQLRPPQPDEGPDDPRHRVVSGLRARGVEARDLSPSLDAAGGGTPGALYLWADGIHLSARGHAVVADALAP